MMSSSGILTADELLTRQTTLQARAREIVAELDLVRIFASVGKAILVGSAEMGLMAWRDIDVDILCPDPDPDHIWDAIRPLASHPCIRKLRWTNESGPFNSTGQLRDDGYYLGIHYHEGGTNDGANWKIDCWFLPAGSPRPESALIDRLHSELTGDMRLAILRIKNAWYQHPDYRQTILSVDIYEAVLDHGIRTPDAFGHHVREKSAT
jgi:hypothetical protein